MALHIVLINFYNLLEVIGFRYNKTFEKNKTRNFFTAFPVEILRYPARILGDSVCSMEW